MAYEMQTDQLWDAFIKDVLSKSEDIVKTSYATFGSVRTVLNSMGITNEYMQNGVIRNWRWELTHVNDKPHRNISHVYGDHASLIDYYICLDCGSIIQTSDDCMDYDDEGWAPPLLCPTCNNLESYYWSTTTKNAKDYDKLHDYIFSLRRFDYFYYHKYWGPLFRFKLWLQGRPRYLWYNIKLRFSAKFKAETEAKLGFKISK